MLKINMKYIGISFSILLSNLVVGQDTLVPKVLSLKELVEVKMVSASNVEENLLDAPANAIIIPFPNISISPINS